MSKEKPYWNSYVAGIALGLVLLGSFVVTGKGLGASGAMVRIEANFWHAVSPTWAEENGVIGNLFGPDKSPLLGWILFLIVGIFLGGFAGAISAGRFKIETVRGPNVSRDVRWLLAFLGGIIAGVGAEIGRGCTSGQALTGGAQLALGSWVFMFAAFGAAYALAYFLRKQWL